MKAWIKPTNDRNLKFLLWEEHFWGEGPADQVKSKQENYSSQTGDEAQKMSDQQ